MKILLFLKLSIRCNYLALDFFIYILRDTFENPTRLDPSRTISDFTRTTHDRTRTIPIRSDYRIREIFWYISIVKSFQTRETPFRYWFIRFYLAIWIAPVPTYVLTNVPRRDPFLLFQKSDLIGCSRKREDSEENSLGLRERLLTAWYRVIRNYLSIP